MEASRVDGVKAPQDAEIVPQGFMMRLLLPEVLLALLLHLNGFRHVPLNPSLHLSSTHLFSVPIFALLLLDQRAPLLRGPIQSKKKRPSALSPRDESHQQSETAADPRNDEIRGAGPDLLRELHLLHAALDGVLLFLHDPLRL